MMTSSSLSLQKSVADVAAAIAIPGVKGGDVSSPPTGKGLGLDEPPYLLPAAALPSGRKALIAECFACCGLCAVCCGLQQACRLIGPERSKNVYKIFSQILANFELASRTTCQSLHLKQAKLYTDILKLNK
jgi:hypothetical protein